MAEGPAASPSRERLLRRAEPVMGTVFSFAVVLGRPAPDQVRFRPAGASNPDEPAAEEAIEEAMRLLRAVEVAWSPYRTDSLVARLRRDEVVTDAAGVHGLEDVLARCEAALRATDGAFDPWAVPRGFDPSGLVKGWAVERAVDLLVRAGLSDVAIGGGGDVTVRGRAPGRRAGWAVGIRDPQDATRVLGRVELVDAAIATSGIYERGRHIVDPRTGRPAERLIAATVVGPDLAWADALSTGVLACADPDPRWLAHLPAYRALAVDGQGCVLGRLRDELVPLAA